MQKGSKGARGRRFSQGLTSAAEAMNASVDFDYRLLDHDVAGSKAHAEMLAAQGIISAADSTAIAQGLDAVRDDLRAGRVEFDPALEDVHMNVEARLSDRIGDAGRRLHTGRSRNDQVATDLRLYTRASCDELVVAVDGVIAAIANVAEAHIDVFMPGYTHLQRAQPIRVAHHLLAYAAMFERDRGRILSARERANECPLGAGALAGTTFDLDRQRVADSLGFSRITRNSLDAVSDRDFAIELVGALALCQSHLSRLCEEIVVWVSTEFRFARLGEQYCSASSIMPQKANPDLAELIRGKVGRVMGDWITLMTVVKALPLAYNKDLQETQEPLYDAVDTVRASLEVAAGMIESLVFDRESLADAVNHGHLLATEVADYLADKGMPFREAHDIAGALVRQAIAKGVELPALALADFQAESDLFDESIFEWLDVEAAVERRNLFGGPAREQVAAQIKHIRER